MIPGFLTKLRLKPTKRYQHACGEASNCKMKNAKRKSQKYFSFHVYSDNLLPFILHFSLAQTWQARIGFRETDTSKYIYETGSYACVVAPGRAIYIFHWTSSET